MAWYIAAALYVWELFGIWIHTLFVTPFQNTQMLWILVPIWLAWFFAEFFQEKRGTSLGNAMSNATVIIWGAVDCMRQTVELMHGNMIKGIWHIIARFSMIGLFLMYGLFIVLLGWKGSKIIRYIGRVREVTYIFVMFVPIFYNVTPISFKHFLATVLFFPLFYYTIELIDIYTPNPKSLQEDEEEGL